MDKYEYSNLTDGIGVSVVCWAIDEDDVLEIDYRLLTDLKVKNLKGKTDPSNQVFTMGRGWNGKKLQFSLRGMVSMIDRVAFDNLQHVYICLC